MVRRNPICRGGVEIVAVAPSYLARRRLLRHAARARRSVQVLEVIDGALDADAEAARPSLADKPVDVSSDEGQEVVAVTLAPLARLRLQRRAEIIQRIKQRFWSSCVRPGQSVGKGGRNIRRRIREANQLASRSSVVQRRRLRRRTTGEPVRTAEDLQSLPSVSASTSIAQTSAGESRAKGHLVSTSSSSGAPAAARQMGYVSRKRKEPGTSALPQNSFSSSTQSNLEAMDAPAREREKPPPTTLPARSLASSASSSVETFSVTDMSERPAWVIRNAFVEPVLTTDSTEPVEANYYVGLVRNDVAVTRRCLLCHEAFLVGTIYLGFCPDGSEMMPGPHWIHAPRCLGRLNVAIRRRDRVGFCPCLPSFQRNQIFEELINACERQESGSWRNRPRPQPTRSWRYAPASAQRWFTAQILADNAANEANFPPVAVAPRQQTRVPRLSRSETNSAVQEGMSLAVPRLGFVWPLPQSVPPPPPSPIGSAIGGTSGAGYFEVQLATLLVQIPAYKLSVAKPSFTTANGGDSDDTVCVICHESLNIGDEVRRLPCTHVFHQACIDRWLRVKTTCPLDNQNLQDLLCGRCTPAQMPPRSTPSVRGNGEHSQRLLTERLIYQPSFTRFPNGAAVRSRLTSVHTVATHADR